MSQSNHGGHHFTGSDNSWQGIFTGYTVQTLLTSFEIPPELAFKVLTVQRKRTIRV